MERDERRGMDRRHGWLGPFEGGYVSKYQKHLYRSAHEHCRVRERILQLTLLLNRCRVDAHIWEGRRSLRRCEIVFEQDRELFGVSRGVAALDISAVPLLS